MRTEPKDVLVVMARYPTPGQVKTRLAGGVGEEAACDVYRAFLLDLAFRFENSPWRLVWAVHPPGADLRRIAGANACCIGQVGDNLAERMRRCFAELLRGRGRRVVMLGADAPHLAEVVIGGAFAALAEHDVSLVPTRDGGYCLIGLRAPHDLFTGVEMGTNSVCAQTLARISELGLRAHVFESTFDVDEVEDLRELDRLLRTGTVELPHTATVLARLRASLCNPTG